MWEGWGSGGSGQLEPWLWEGTGQPQRKAVLVAARPSGLAWEDAALLLGALEMLLGVWTQPYPAPREECAPPPPLLPASST